MGPGVMSQVGPAAPKLTLPVKALYGLGALGTASKMQLFGLVLFFYSELAGLDARWVSLAISISIFVDAFWDPLVGQISDNTRSRLGRRHPFIYAAAVPAAICFALLFMPPLGWADQALFFYLLAFVIAGRMFDSLHEIPSSALMPELTRDYNERTSVQSWRYFFGAVAGGAVAAFLGYGVFLRGTKTQPFGQLNMAGYAPYAITVAVISVVVVIVSALATQRFVPFMHQTQRQRPSLGAIAREAGVALSNRNFVALAGSALIFGISVGISGGLTVYFYTYFWELPSKALLSLRLWAIPAGVFGVIFAPMVARAFGKKRACLVVFFLAIFSTTIPLGARLLGVMPPNSSPWVLRILIIDTMTTAALATLGFIIVGSMLADVVEDAQLRTGQRSEGLLFAAESLLRKLTSSFSALIPGFLLAFVGFPLHAQPGHVDQAVLSKLALIYLPITTVLTLCSTSVLMLYRIDRAGHEKTLQRLTDAPALTELADPIVGP